MSEITTEAGREHHADLHNGDTCPLTRGAEVCYEAERIIAIEQEARKDRPQLAEACHKVFCKNLVRHEPGSNVPYNWPCRVYMVALTEALATENGERK